VDEPAHRWSGAAERPVIASIALRTPPGEDEARLMDRVALKVGERLTPRELRRTVQALYGLGRFGNVVVRASPAASAPGQVALVLDCLPRREVASVRIVDRASPPALDEERVRRAAGLGRGDELWPGRLEQVAARVRDAYARRGYRGAQVRAAARGEPRADVELAVEEGKPTRVVSLALVPAGAAPPGVLQAIATRAGATLDLDALESDVRALRARLRRDGFLRARVGSPVVGLSAEEARVEFPVEAGPRVEFRFEGATALALPELRAGLGLEEEQVLDAPAVEAAARRLRALYVARGYAAARVTPREVPSVRQTSIVFQVDEGRRYRVRSVLFSGAVQKSRPWLRSRLDEALEALAPPDDGGRFAEAERLARASGFTTRLRSRALAQAREVWNPAVWDQAALRLVELYRAEGFLDAAHEGTRAALDARSGIVDVEVRLREGVRTRIEAIAFEGNQLVPAEDLARAARLSPGDPLAYSEVEATRAALLVLYGRRGHLYARVVEVEELSADRTRATVRFRIEEGPRVRVGSVLVNGARRTRHDVVRETLTLRPGDVYDPDAAAKSQAALLRLGVFRSVGLRLADPEVPDATKDLTVDVAERPWRTLAPGIGFSLANGPRAFVELVQPNLFGRALELSARAKVNYPLATLFGKEIRADAKDLERKQGLDRVEGRLELGLHDPRVRLFGLGVGARVDGIAEQLHRAAYDLSRGSIVFGLDFPLGSRVSLALQDEIELDHIVKTRAAQTLTFVDVERLRFGDGLTALQSLRPVLAIDFRDSSVYPRSGWLATATADYVHSIATSVFTHMLKLSAALSGYLPVGTRSVLALTLRGGRVLSIERASQTILPKRFYLGGASTMRGYGEEEMIPADVRGAFLDEVRACASSLSGLACSAVANQLAQGQTLVSPGGEAFVLAKAELRFPLREGIEMGAFVDAGNLWLDPRAVSFADLRLNFGLGLRVLTPIGPAVLDFGVNTSADSRLGERFLAPHFSIGLF
jgi:outer membrane protein assembly factor BamA